MNAVDVISLSNVSESKDYNNVIKSVTSIRRNQWKPSISKISQKVTSWNRNYVNDIVMKHVNIFVLDDALESKDYDKAIKIVVEIWWSNWNSKFIVINA